ncbi:hypothetical protein F5884DRAFT_753778 [Xylogone sp. PMI_703]|nr:hypothetical protein F5884DRAFT_753778 [Xylogone sp. PMI_703]
MRHYSALGLWALTQGVAGAATTTVIPDFVRTYAPLVFLDQNEAFFPSDIGAQVSNTSPEVNFTTPSNIPPNLSLDDLDVINSLDNCVDTQSCNIFLTSKTDITKNPPYLTGVIPDTTSFETVGAISCAVIVHDHGNSIVDAFYMYFYAFNQGLQIIGQVQGDHVGDWEHNAIRFQDGKPISVWYSQHNSGQAFSYDALSKNGVRPIVYSAVGSHANYAVPGTHAMVQPIPGGPIMNISSITLNDFTSAGAIWDPILSAYFYTYTPTSATNGTFVPEDPSFPVSWLHFLGRWGDKQYPDSDPRQQDLLNLHLSFKFEDGPTGPIAKSLNRSDICPDGTTGGCTTSSALPAVSGSSIPVTVTRTAPATATGTSTGPGVTATGSSGGNSNGTVSGTGKGPVPTASPTEFPSAAGHIQVVMSIMSLPFMMMMLLLA